MIIKIENPGFRKSLDIRILVIGLRIKRKNRQYSQVKYGWDLRKNIIIQMITNDQIKRS